MARGVPLEVMIRLANDTGTEPWFTIPHLADDGLIVRMAETIRDQLDPGLRAWIEFSNETWNWSFSAGQPCPHAGASALGQWRSLARMERHARGANGADI